MGAAAIIALLTEFETLAKLTNVGALFVVAMVGGVTLWRRYTPPADSEDQTTPPFYSRFARLVLLVGLSISKTLPRACVHLPQT